LTCCERGLRRRIDASAFKVTPKISRMQLLMDLVVGELAQGVTYRVGMPG
jgi:hypothetical protein